VLRILHPRLGLAIGLFCLTASALAAPPAAETLLPNTTKAFVSIPQFPDATARFDKTRLGQAVADPQMEPFFEDMRRQLRDKFFRNKDKLGASWEDFEQAAAGEVALGVVHTPRSSPALVLTMDVTGRDQQVQALLNKVAQDMTARRARKTQTKAAGATIDAFEIPATEAGGKPSFAYYTVHNHLLVASDELPVIDGVLRRMSAPSPETLANLPTYKNVMARCAAGSKNNAPQMRWYIDPLGAASALEAMEPPPGSERPRFAPRNPVPSRVGAARNQAQAAAPVGQKKESRVENARRLGFDAIQAVGGFVYMPPEQYDFLYYTAISAPKPWKGSMNMLAFPNSASAGDLHPAPWVPGYVDSHIAFNLDIRTAEANFGPLFDQMFGEGESGVWTDVKDSLRDDPNGPKVDLVKDLIYNLGQRCTFIVDHKEPITTTCERSCLGIVASNPKGLADAIRKSMETDPNVKHRQVGGFDIWEMVEEQIDVPQVELEGSARGAAEEVEPAPQRLMPRSAVCVAHGHLFVASHVNFLEEILALDPTKSLANEPDYQAAAREMATLGSNQDSFRFFVRGDQSAEATYELLRMNKMPEAQTMLAQALNRVLNEQGEETRKREFDGSKLPPFAEVKRYFGWGGAFVQTEANGWFAVGFSPSVTGAQVGALPTTGVQK
jgi:hypothetical protein